jgi:hypothetical protein
LDTIEILEAVTGMTAENDAIDLSAVGLSNAYKLQ